MTRWGRITGWYVAGLAVPTLLLLLFTVSAIRNQQKALEVIRRANRELRTEQAESRRSVEKLRRIEACFRDSLWTLLPASHQKLSRDHPLARHFLLWRNGSAILPHRIHAPADLALPATLVAAEALELSGQDLPAALRVYERIASSAVDGSTKALALQRAARTLRKLGQDLSVIAIWRRLGAEFADQTDPFGRPYGLLAAFEPAPDEARARSAYDRFQNRQWPLSLEQQAFFLERFETVLGRDAVATAARRLREEEDLHRAISYIVHPQGTPARWEARSRPIVLDDRSFELWTLETAEAPEREVRALVVDLEWVAANLSPRLPEPAAESSGLAPWIFGSLAAFVAGSLVLAAVLLMRVSAREVQLEREKAESLIQLCHDVNNALTAVSVKTQALLEPEALSPEETEETCGVIWERVDTLGRWISRELQKIRAEAPLGVFAPILLHRPELVFEHAARSFWKTLRAPDRDLSIEIREPLPPTPLDPQAVERAFSNLLENACKYSSSESTILLRASAESHSVLVEIHNTGDVIPRQERRKIFALYYRSRAAAARRGFGIGLNVVRQVMKAHGGRIEVRSSPAAGTVFRLFFPTEVRGAKHTDRRG